MKSLKPCIFMLLILLFSGIGGWSSGQDPTTVEELQRLMQEKDETIKDLLKRLEDYEMQLAVPGEAGLKEQLDACVRLTKRQKVLIQALEKNLKECKSKLQQCEAKTGDS